EPLEGRGQCRAQLGKREAAVADLGRRRLALVGLAGMRCAARQAVRQRMDHRHLRREQNRPRQHEDSPGTKQLRRHGGRLAPPRSLEVAGGAYGAQITIGFATRNHMPTGTAANAPSRRASPARLAVQLLLGAVLLLVLWRLRDVALITFAAIIAAALLRGLAHPVVRYTRLSSRVAIVVVIVALVVLMLAALWLTGQPMLRQLQELRSTVPRAWATALSWLQAQPFGPQLLNWLDSGGELKVPWDR